jgi:hypothetical protein
VEIVRCDVVGDLMINYVRSVWEQLASASFRAWRHLPRISHETCRHLGNCLRLCHLPALVSVVILAAAAAGCVSKPNGLVLDTVGPSEPSQSPAGDNGSLVVYSAFDPVPHFDSLTYRSFYTDYEVFSEQGQLLQTVHNDGGTALEGPRPVSLPPGRYRVVARANGFRKVTVPVVIAAHHITTVHLEGGAAWGSRAQGGSSSLVRLPDGQVVGEHAGLDH